MSRAQLDVLTLHEAGKIVSILPGIVASRERGECPMFDPSEFENMNAFSIQVRGRCVPPDSGGSSLINSYVVNRLTGAVRTGIEGSVGEPADTPGTKALARVLLAQARSRVLSDEEARCLASQAVLDAGRPGESVLPSAPRMSAARRLTYEIRGQLKAARAIWRRSLTVDIARFTARFAYEPFDVRTAGFAALAAQLKLIHEPSETLRRTEEQLE